MFLLFAGSALPKAPNPSQPMGLDSAAIAAMVKGMTATFSQAPEVPEAYICNEYRATRGTTEAMVLHGARPDLEPGFPARVFRGQHGGFYHYCGTPKRQNAQDHGLHL